MKIQIGPLGYEFLAHDAWGRDTLSRLSRHVEIMPFKGSPYRTIHLVECKLESVDFERMRRGALPEKLWALLPQKTLEQGWQIAPDTCGCPTGSLNAWHPATAHTFWIHNTFGEHYSALFWLPWSLIAQDIVNMGGGLIHGGLAMRKNKASLFTAPPGGGKSTTLLRLPSSWRVLSDDACLVWPSGTGTYRISPLPTYSVMLGIQKLEETFNLWQSAESFELGSIFFIEKAHQERLLPFKPIQATQPLYSAFSEHPGVLEIRDPFRKHLFHLAGSICQQLPSWKLQLSLNADLSSLLEAIFRLRNSDCLLFAYEGKSMFPTFQKDDLLVVEIVLPAEIRRGDCIVLRKPFADFVAHRVVSVYPQLKTRGDGQSIKGEEQVSSSDIVGLVKARIRDTQYCRVPTGVKGMFVFRLSWLARVLEPSGGGKGAKVGRFIRGLVSLVLRPWQRQMRIVSFSSSRGEKNYQLMLGTKVMGKYNKQTQTWSLYWPYCLIFDASLLPPLGNLGCCAG